VRGLRTDRIPQDIDGLMGYYSFDAGVPITAGTWQAIRSSANVALTGLDAMLATGHSTFALCRPPGHHAAADYMGGYCYLNNAAIAAQAMLDRGAKRVAILDVDYHHGNGTQSIFYQRSDVQFLSLHGDPTVEYPFFLGHADEPGRAPGWASITTTRWPMARTGRTTARPWPMPAARLPPTHRTRWWCRWGWIPSSRTRSRVSN
jgi:acetoin utilization deacetylase AcuC-like enzyme